MQVLFFYRHGYCSGHNGSDISLPSSGVNPLLSNSDDGNEFLNNNLLDNNGGVTEVCDVPDEIANQKRHVSTL